MARTSNTLGDERARLGGEVGCADGRDGYSSHRIASRLIIHGAHLSTATVELRNVSGSPIVTGLTPDATSSDARIDLTLPSSVIAGQYIVAVTNAAGSDQADATILQGEDGTAITGDEVITRIDEARAGGTLLVADRLGSLSEADVTAMQAELAATQTILSNLPASANLLRDTRLFGGVQPGLSNITADLTAGPWRYYKFDDFSAAITVEDPPQELMDLVQPNDGGAGSAWWPQPFKVLHVSFIASGGAAPGRLLQLIAPSEKSGPVTMSAWVKVLSGTLRIGQEDLWETVANGTWERVSVTHDTPNATLGGAFGFGADGTATSEALIALPKVEMSPLATPYVESARDSVRTIARVHGLGPNDQTDSGLIVSRELTFNKARADTGLRVAYNDNFRVTGAGNACRWEITFNSSSCTDPGAIVFDEHAAGNEHNIASVFATCFGLPAGPVTLNVTVGQSPGYSGGDCFTGWNNSYWSIEAEEVY